MIELLFRMPALLRRARRALPAAAVLCMVLGWGEPSAAQGQPGFHSLGRPAGIRYYVPGKWAVVEAELYNPRESEVRLLATSYFAGSPNSQYGREYWVPPKCVRRSMYPVLTPAGIPRDKQSIEVLSLLYDRTSGTDEMLRGRSSEQVHHSELLPTLHDRAVTLFIADRSTPEGAKAQDAFEAAIAMRVAQDLTRRVLDVPAANLPPTADGLDGATQIIIPGDEIATNGAALSAVRRWLQEGGKLWIMLDRVSESTVRALLGDSFHYEVVDRVGLTTVKAERVAVNTVRNVLPDEERMVDKPVDLLRVLPADVDVEYAIGGWPVAFWQRFGHGEVLFTTLGPHGWMRPRTPEDPKVTDPERNSSYIATRSLAELGVRLLEARTSSAVEVEKFEPLLTEQIGYRIVRRSTVIAMLGSFCAAVLIAGIWFARRGQLQRLAWFSPAAAIVAALALATTGMQSRRAVPPTVATAQFSEAVPGSPDVRVSGMSAIFSPETEEGRLGSQGGGMLEPKLGATINQVRRIVWTDEVAWHWENIDLPAAVVTLAPFRTFTRVAEPLTVRGTFDTRGFSGTISSGPYQGLSDAIIVRDLNQRIAANLAGSGKVTAAAEDVLDPGEYLSAGVLEDEQRRRQAVYRALLSDGPLSRPNPQPMLMAWAEPVDLQFEFPGEPRRIGGSLISIPVEVERPPVGTEVVVPSVFLWCQDAADPFPVTKTATKSSAFDSRTGQWNQATTSMRTWLRFEVPAALRPLELQKGVLTVAIEAPRRKVAILGKGQEAAITLAETDSPVGRFQYEITNSEALQLDEAGGLLIGLDVGAEIPKSGAPWQVDFVQLELTGKTLEP